MKEIRVTLDTNLLDEENDKLIQEATFGLPIEYSRVSVSDRELTEWNIARQYGLVMETAVWGESQWGLACWGTPYEAELFPILLKIISSGSFPDLDAQGELTEVQRHHLRDAMILATHVREGRDILVSNDKKAYGAKDKPKNIARRAKLEEICNTRIMPQLSSSNIAPH
jgi:hypothetical protein